MDIQDINDIPSLEEVAGDYNSVVYPEPLIKEADPELERILAEEEEIYQKLANTINERKEKLRAGLQYGVYNIAKQDLVGMTIGEVKKMYGNLWGLPQDAIAVRNQEVLQESDVLHDGDYVMFERRAPRGYGQKC